MGFRVSGVVRVNGVPVPRRVAAFRRDSGLLAGAVTSGLDGVYSIPTLDASDHYVVCFPASDELTVDPLFNLVTAQPLISGGVLSDAVDAPFTKNQVVVASNGGPDNYPYLDFSDATSFLSYSDPKVGAFGKGDFTVEFWAYRKGSTGGYCLLVGQDVGGFFALLNPSNQLLYVQAGGSDLYQTTYVLPLNTWVHVAYCRFAGTTRVFAGGVQVGSFPDTHNYSSEQIFGVGTSSGYVPTKWLGYFSNVRVINGVAAYKSDFTPNPTPFSKVSFTNAKIVDYVVPEVV